MSGVRGYSNFVIYSDFIIFGDQNWIAVINEIDKIDLKDYTDQEDFILGIRLSYDRLKQWERYLKIKAEKSEIKNRIPG